MADDDSNDINGTNYQNSMLSSNDFAEEETNLLNSTTEMNNNHSNNKKRPRKKQGRRARRKMNKVAEIEKAAADAVVSASSGTTTTTRPTTTTTRTAASKSNNATSRLPTDRSYVLPAVQKLQELSSKEKVDLSKQLGYLPGNALRVVATTKDVLSPSSDDDDDDDSLPLVLELYPLALRDESDGKYSKRKRRKQQRNKESKASSNETGHVNEMGKGGNDDNDSSTPLLEPFPTIYWLTDPRMRALISKLELDRWTTKYEKQLEENSIALQQMKAAHKEYAQRRQQLLTPEDMTKMRDCGWYDTVFDFSLSKKGIAGIQNHTKLKCLHTHAAHYLSGYGTNNVVGKWVIQEVQRMLLGSKDDKDNQDEED